MFQKTGYFYSGPYARYMVDDYVEGIDVPDYNKWEVFVLCKFNEDMELLQGAQLLHQVYICIDFLKLIS